MTISAIRNRRSIRILCRVLAGLLLAMPGWAHGSGRPTVLALIPPSLTDPAREAVWQRAAAAVENDPLILFRDSDQVGEILNRWRDEESAARKALEAAGLAHQGRIREAMDRAWGLYYRLDFAASLDALAAIPLPLSHITDPEAAVDVLFERSILSGMNRKALGDNGYEEDFRAAAAIRPGIRLSPDRYSPEIDADFRRAFRELERGSAATLTLVIRPPDAVVTLDGSPVVAAGVSRLDVLPGEHVLSVDLAGYRPHRELFTVGNWEGREIAVDLVPSAPPHPAGVHLSDRLLAGDREYLASVAERLEVDGLLLAHQEADTLKAWVVDSRGTVRAGTVLAPPEADRALAELLAPFRVSLDFTTGGDLMPAAVSLAPPVAEDPEPARPRSRWLWLLGGAVLLALVAGGSGDGGTAVEVQW